MNPWAFVILGIGTLMIIMGVKGSYGNVISALTGKPYNATAKVTTAALLSPGSTGSAGGITANPQIGTVPKGGIGSTFPLIGHRTPGNVMV